MISFDLYGEEKNCYKSYDIVGERIFIHYINGPFIIMNRWHNGLYEDIIKKDINTYVNKVLGVEYIAKKYRNFLSVSCLSALICMGSFIDLISLTLLMTIPTVLFGISSIVSLTVASFLESRIITAKKMKRFLNDPLSDENLLNYDISPKLESKINPNLQEAFKKRREQLEPISIEVIDKMNLKDLKLLRKNMRDTVDLEEREQCKRKVRVK